MNESRLTRRRLLRALVWGGLALTTGALSGTRRPARVRLRVRPLTAQNLYGPHPWAG